MLITQEETHVWHYKPAENPWLGKIGPSVEPITIIVINSYSNNWHLNLYFSIRRLEKLSNLIREVSFCKW